MYEKNPHEYVSVEHSRQYAQALQQLKSQVESAVRWEPDNVAYLACDPQFFGSGAPLPFTGIITANPRILEYPDKRISFAVMSHERAHQHIGGALRRAVFAEHPAIDEYFKTVILPNLLSGETELPDYDSDFIRSKYWSGIATDWNGFDITPEDAKTVMNNYFWLLERDGLQFMPNGKLGMQVLDERLARRYPREPIPMNDLHQKNKGNFLVGLVTGYALGEDMWGRRRDSISRRFGQELWETEEGYANFVGLSLSGISAQTLQAVATQDESKLEIEGKIRQKWNGSVQEFLDQFKDYESFAEWCTKR